MQAHLSFRDSTRPGFAPATGSASISQYAHPISVAADQIVLLDYENVVQISGGSARFVALRLGPVIGSYLRSLGTTSLALGEQGPASASFAARLLDHVARDDLFSLKLELSRASHRAYPHRRSAALENRLCTHEKHAPINSGVVFSGHQPGYFRSLGFFAKMAISDIFCFADDMQFVRGEWQNRQRFPRPDNRGTLWLTVPLLSGSGFESIRSKRIANENRDRDWKFKHWRTIESACKRAPYFDRYAPFLHTLYQRKWRTLGALCEAITRHSALELGIERPALVNSSQVGFSAGLRKGERIAAEIQTLRRQLSSKRPAVYLSGAGASYLDVRRFSGVPEKDFLEHRGIEIRSCTVDSGIIARETGLDPHSPAIAFLFHLGADAGRVMKEAVRCR